MQALAFSTASLSLVGRPALYFGAGSSLATAPAISHCPPAALDFVEVRPLQLPSRAAAGFPPRRRASHVALCEAEAAVASPDNSSPPAPKLVLDDETKFQLAILLSTSFLVQMGVGMGIVVLPMFAQSLGLGQMGVGLLVALPQLTKLLFNLPVGYLVDVVGRKPPLIWGALIDTCGQIATGAARTMGQLVPARLVVGVGSATGGSTGAAASAYQMDVVSKYPEHSGLLLGLIQALGFLSFAVGPAVGGIIAERGGPSLPFYLLGGALLLSAPLKARLATPSRPPPHSRLAARAIHRPRPAPPAPCVRGAASAAGACTRRLPRHAPDSVPTPRGRRCCQRRCPRRAGAASS